MSYQNVSSTYSLSLSNETEIEFDNFVDLCASESSLDPTPSTIIQFCLVVLYLLITLLSLIGNLVVIIVQVYGTKSNQNIRKYLINLALSDLIIGVLCVSFNYSDFVLGQWHYPHWLCPTVQYIQPLCVFITSITLSLIGLERYTFALHPLSALNRILQSHTRAILLSTWIIGIFYSYFIFGNTKIRENSKNGQTYYECINSSALSAKQRRVFMAVNFTLTFLCPMVMLTFTYSAIMKALLNAKKGIIENKSRKRENVDSISCRLKIIKMLLTVIVLYAVCWMPIKIYQILFEFGILQYCTPTQFYALVYTYILCHWLAMANSFVNPIVYASMNTSFRYDFWKISRSITVSMLSLGKQRKVDDFDKV